MSELLFKDFSVGRLVVNDQDFVAHTRWTFGLCCSALFVVDRKHDGKRRTFTHFTFNTDLATQKIHEPLNDRQPQPRASILLLLDRSPW